MDISGDREVDVVTRFVGELHGLERQLVSIYAASSRLALAAADARSQIDLTGVAGHQILAAITAGTLAITEAMARTAEGHRMAETLARHRGLDVSAYGDKRDPPPNAFTTGAVDQVEVA